MSRCHSCGQYISGGSKYFFTCPNCDTNKEIAKLRREIIPKLNMQNSSKMDQMAELQQLAFKELSQTMSDRLSELVSVVQWGFEDIGWKLEQQTSVLRSIDEKLSLIAHELEYQDEYKAKALREQAEKLRSLGKLNLSRDKFLMAIDLNPLDYQSYIGLGYTYLFMTDFDNALDIFNESLAYAPKGNIDYQSYSYRHIGRIYFCKEDFEEARDALYEAVELSPEYTICHYEYAQYCAQTEDDSECLKHLKEAIGQEPFYFQLARHEGNFEPLRYEVNKLLDGLMTSKKNRINNILSDLESYMK